MIKFKKLIAGLTLGVLSVGMGVGVIGTQNADVQRADAAANEIFKLVEDLSTVKSTKTYTLMVTQRSKYDGNWVALGAHNDTKNYFQTVSIERASDTATIFTTTAEPLTTFNILKDNTKTGDFLYQLKIDANNYICALEHPSSKIKNIVGTSSDATAEGTYWGLSINANKEIDIKSSFKGYSSSAATNQYLRGIPGQKGSYAARISSYNGNSNNIALQLYEKQEAVKITSVSITNTEKDVYAGASLNMKAKVEPSTAPQNVSWSIKAQRPATSGQVVATINATTGALEGVNPGEVDIIATSFDGTVNSTVITLKVLENKIVEFKCFNPTSVKPQYENENFDSTGLVFKYKRAVGEYTEVKHSDITFNPNVMAVGVTSVKATYAGLDFVIENIEVLKNDAVIFTKATSVADIKVGSRIIIASPTDKRIMSAEFSENNKKAVPSTGLLTNNTLKIKSADINTSYTILDVENGTKPNTFAFYDASEFNYLAATSSSSKNYLKSTYVKEDNSSWKVTLDSSNKFEIVAQGAATKNRLLYNDHNSYYIFNCYDSNFGFGSNVDIYVNNPKMDEALSIWANNHLRINDSKFVGDGYGSCRTIYKDAKDSMNDLDTVYAGFMNGVQTNAEYNARLTAWAKACNNDNPYDGKSYVKPSFKSYLNGNNSDTMIIIIVAISVLSVSAIALLTIAKRKKATR